METTMLDRKLVLNNPSLIRSHLEKRHASPDAFSTLDQLSEVLGKRRTLQNETDMLRGQRNELSKQIGPLMQAGKRDEAEPLRDQVKEVGNTLAALEEQRKELANKEEQLLLSLPNLVADNVPAGASETENVEIRTWGTPADYDFEVKDHVKLGEDAGILDFERAAKLSGARFPVYIGMGALLERALINFFLDRATQQNGYTELIVPYIVSRTTMTGTGQLPKFGADLFKLTDEVNGEEAYLIPTAEVPVTNLHSNEILKEDQLPIAYTTFTPCFRSEAGSYGKDVRGLIRQHQFHKVEMVRICTEEQAWANLELLSGHAEALLQELELPYRLVALSAGDLGVASHFTYDFEVWLPSQNTYREISSCSWFCDFQARRMMMRYRPSDGGKPKICHTINGSGLAVGRTVVAILENNQQADGSIRIPEVLRPWMGGLARIPGRE